MSPTELEASILDLLDGNCEGEQLRALVKELESSQNARALYRKHVRIDALISMQEEDLAHAQRSVVPVDLLLKRQQQRVLRFTMIATVAASIIATCLLMWTVLPNPPSAKITASPGSQFSLTHSPEEGTRPPQGNLLRIGSRLTLNRGTVELKTDSGVEAIVRAPAALTLASESRIELDRGIAWFDVPKKATGFQVETRELLITDLGTTFGVISDDNLRDEVHVFSGKVELQQLRVQSDPVNLTAGNASSSSWDAVPLSPKTFLTSLPSTAPNLPYIYWSFDEKSVLPFSVGGTWEIADRINSTRGFMDEGPEFVGGKLGRALNFDQSRDYIETDWPGITGTAPRTVAMWVKLPGPDPNATTEYNSTLLTWGEQAIRESNGSWSLRATTRDLEIAREGHPELSARTLFQVRLGASWINGTTDLADGQWHHLAASFDGRIDPEGLPLIQLFVDGRLEEMSKWHHFARPEDHQGASWPPVFHTNTSAEGTNPLLIGRSKTRPTASCDAAIDEVFIFNGAISESLVRSLATAAPGWQP